MYFSALISLLTMLPQLFFSPNVTHSAYLLLTLVLLITISKFSKILFSVFVVFINLSNVLIGHIAMHWGYTLPDIQPRIEVAFLSPVYETQEYITSYVDYRDYLLIAFSGLVLVLLYKFLRHYSHSYKVFRMIGLGVSASILLTVSFYVNPLKEVEPFSVPCEVCSVMEDKNKIENILQERAKFIRYLNVEKAGTKNQRYDKIIIVMGESANKHHMQLYGYSVPTTPFLTSLRHSSGLYVLDAIAPTNQTRYSIPIDLTGAKVHDYEHRYMRSASLITYFKRNGYETYWISNQGRAGKNDSTIASMAYEADTTFFANLNYLDAALDDVLVHYLGKMERNSQKELFVIHLMGSHSDYVNRYDKAKALFKQPKNMVEEYDNTIHYTDYILGQIYERFKNERLLLIYLSDHGENINLENNGHGFLPSFKDEYTVPFVIYSNVPNPRLEEIYRDNKKGYFNLENFDSTVQYVGGISNHKNLSYSPNVMAIEPNTIVNFDELEFYN